MFPETSSHIPIFNNKKNRIFKKIQGNFDRWDLFNQKVSLFRGNSMKSFFFKNFWKPEKNLSFSSEAIESLKICRNVFKKML